MIGEIAALSTALAWAIAARMYRVLGQSFSPLALNLWKGLAAIVILLVVTQWVLPPLSLPASAYWWLLFSGVIGIGLGDTFFFKALNSIGDSQSILIAETLAPIFTALLAMAWINEWLSWYQWLGIALVILSVDIIVKVQKRTEMQLYAPTGYVYAALAALCQAVGAVVSRDMLTSYELDAFNASLIRLIGGLVCIVILMLIFRSRWLPTTDNPKRTWMFFAGATLLGTFAALYLQMVAFTYTKAAIVQTLFATSVILSLGVAWVLKEKVNKQTLLWSIVAFVGVVILVVTEG